MTERTSVTLSLTCGSPTHRHGMPRVWHYADTDIESARLRATNDGWGSTTVADIVIRMCPHCARASQ